MVSHLEKGLQMALMQLLSSEFAANVAVKRKSKCDKACNYRVWNGMDGQSLESPS